MDIKRNPSIKSVVFALVANLIVGFSPSSVIALNNQCENLFPPLTVANETRQINRDWLTNNNLNEELNFSGLSSDSIQHLQKYSGGLFTLKDFLQNLNNLNPTYKLGLDYFRQVSAAILNTTKISRDAYKEFGILGSEPEHTQKILTSMLNSNKTIAFFVPRNILTHPDRNVTANEMEWLLNVNPVHLQKVIFIFGAYDIFKEEHIPSYLSQNPTVQDRIKTMSLYFEYLKRSESRFPERASKFRRFKSPNSIYLL